MKKFIRTKIQAGVKLVDEKPVFNWNSDNYDEDVVLLTSNVSGEFDLNGIRTIYGYEFNPKSDAKQRIKFRKFLKSIGSDENIMFLEEVDEFVENGILHIEDYQRLDSFEAIVYSESHNELSLTDVMWQFFAEYCTHLSYSFEMIKQTYQDVQFDEEKARRALEQSGTSSTKVEREIQFTLKKFNQLKSTGELFQMKRFIPREIREGFYNFFKFKNKQEQDLYMSLQGVDVLIYGDFLTSGSTVKEIARYLRSFHDENRLTVFVLVKQ